MWLNVRSYVILSSMFSKQNSNRSLIILIHSPKQTTTTTTTFASSRKSNVIFSKIKETKIYMFVWPCAPMRWSVSFDLIPYLH